VALRLMATSCTAVGLSACWARIVLAVLGEIGGCGVLASARACPSWREGGGISSTELSRLSIGGGTRMGEPERGDAIDRSYELSADMIQQWIAQWGSLQKAACVWACVRGSGLFLGLFCFLLGRRAGWEVVVGSAGVGASQVGGGRFQKAAVEE